MLKTLLKTTALFLLLSCSLSSVAQENLSPKQLLGEMKKAAQQLNYEFSFVQTTPSNMDSLRYRHFVADGKTYAQLVTLDGPQQEIVQRENLISYFQPNYQAFTINGSGIIDNLPPLSRANFDALEKYYDFVNIGRNRVADHVVQTIRILPKDDFRYQYLAFIDEENHLLLRTDMLDREGNLLDQFRVVNLYIGNELSGLPAYLNRVVFPPLLMDQKANNPPAFKWQPGWLPQGFKLVNHSIELDGEEKIESQLYSDGLFSFTLYVSDKIAESTQQDNTWRQGAYTIYTESMENKEMTIIGQLPISTAKRIVQDIEFRK
ncbi:Sigma-E factor regulatory protein rseB precursor [Aggregatibacter actinomycetemcomitans]|uniref:sigma-E factor regulatory protein RseB n=1 Tax=Aggregatibacter actinomycetemcomitans TaxID=714 RepID=UPI0001B9F3BC|nr:sigma-E factor regulatory protein RseB [Aggregatibacter actinomycetemcomitans]ACX82135.1 sigma-E factor regulatory protein RseB [Aggregatibacter actinomycetemcomitans D11S-1]AHN71383.1 sigma-E factor regulatory protein RseBprecursor, putative' [Aggregatibacter actinomycetemcomitans HK1651]AMQ91231.1 transcriptional regulator [Aggregatibacter actinomycetemcomitans]KOE54734.1 sigma-E factor regulatory protein RseB [Aggregatibacter actinomycetemcomitans serotype b str. SCC4092]KOE59589.1 sigma